MPTIEEYQKAKEITRSYESEQKRLYDEKVESFRKDLTEYFSNNLIDGRFRLESFELSEFSFGGGNIIHGGELAQYSFFPTAWLLR